jgi:hypothetical protein
MAYLGTKPANAVLTSEQIGDGVITTADLANGAVTDAKIAAMAASKLTGQLPNANAPSGSVIQVVTGVDTAAYSIGENNILSWSIAITPTSTSSRILLFWQINWNSSNPNGYMLVTRNSGNLNPNISVANAFAGTGKFRDLDERPQDTWNIFPDTNIAYDSPNTTSSCTYVFGIGTTTSGANVKTGRSNESASYRAPSFQGFVMEIAG